MTITVYQCDAEGWLIGTSPAFESPLEPGVYMIPAGCTPEPPPADVPDGTFPRWVAGRWATQVYPQQPVHQGGV